MRKMRLGAILTVIGGLAIASLRWGGVSEAKGQSQSQAQSQATSAQSSPPRPRERQYKDTVFFPPQADLSWPLTGPTQNYASINGAHLT
jgi:hypothetical protein